MFILSKVEDNVRIVPSELSRPTAEAVLSVIENNFVDKVVPNLGLVVTVYDILSIEGGFIYPSDGAAHFKAVFRLVVFRPFEGEVLVGKLKSSDRTGLHISLGFFKDVHVPDYALPDPSFYSEEEHVWFWRFDGEQMFLDPGEDIRLRVKEVRFEPEPWAGARAAAQPGSGAEESQAAARPAPHAPLRLIGSIAEEGCGVTAWWEQPDDAAATEG